eukprot:3456724-Prymnesium_polylepis.2
MQMLHFSFASSRSASKPLQSALKHPRTARTASPSGKRALRPAAHLIPLRVDWVLDPTPDL